MVETWRAASPYKKEIILNKVARVTVPKYPAKAKSDLVYINNKSI